MKIDDILTSRIVELRNILKNNDLSSRHQGMILDLLFLNKYLYDVLNKKVKLLNMNYRDYYMKKGSKDGL